MSTSIPADGSGGSRQSIEQVMFIVEGRSIGTEIEGENGVQEQGSL